MNWIPSCARYVSRQPSPQSNSIFCYHSYEEGWACNSISTAFLLPLKGRRGDVREIYSNDVLSTLWPHRKITRISKYFVKNSSTLPFIFYFKDSALMGAHIVQIPATKLQWYRFLRQDTVCTPLPNIQMLYKGRRLVTLPAHIAAIRPFLLSWSFRMSFTAGDCMKKPYQKSLFGVDYLKHRLNIFHCKFINKFYKENQPTTLHPASGQRAMKTLRRKTKTNTCPTRKEQGNQKELQGSTWPT